MQDKKALILIVLAASQLVILLPIGLVNPMSFSDNGWFNRNHAIAIILGCGFAQASVAAAWMALGPLAFRVRALCSAAWVLLAAILLAVNIAVHSPSVEEGVFLSLSFVGVWCFVQAPLWIARSIYRLQLVSWADSNPFAIVGEHQFGIRQLLIVTAAVAAALGFGRLMVLGFSPSEQRVGLGGAQVEMLVIVGLFILCNSLVAFTVITGALLPRHWLFAMALGCCAATAISLVEWSLFSSLVTGPDRREALVIVGGMNGLQFSWLLFCLLALRLAGYRLIASTRSREDS